MRRDTPDAMPAAGIAHETQGADDDALRILDPEMAGVCSGIARVDVRIGALLLDDEDGLPYGEDAEQRAWCQLVETSGVNLRYTGLVQVAAIGSTAAVQNEQRFAGLGMMLRHSGHARVFDSVGFARRACMRLYGTTKKK